MELTFVNDLGQSFVVEIDPNMELENVMALLEAEVSGEHTPIARCTQEIVPILQSGIPVNEQSISHEGRDLSNPKATMRECGVGDHAMLLLRRKVSVAGRWVLIPSPSELQNSMHCLTQDSRAGCRDDAPPAPRRPRAHAAAAGGASPLHRLPPSL